jgi:Phosphotransferase enzyme family
MSHPTPPYGFDDDDATRRLLRTRPPRAALAWAGAVLGGPVVSARPLRGGQSSAIHLLTVAPPGGSASPAGHAEPPRRAVLRRYVRGDLNAEEPDIAEREARTLRFVESLPLPTPRLLACDHTGEAAGVPAVLMSHLPGRVDWRPSDMGSWLRRLAEVLVPVHAATPPPPGVIRRFAAYRQNSYEPPSWARMPRVWARAAEIFRGSSPGPVGSPEPGAPRFAGMCDADPDVFIHRDYHPGNVLWRRGSVTGVVDWQSASVGPASIDVSHCRGNLLGYGADVAGRFVAIWEEITGKRFHPGADIVTIIGFLDWLRDDPPTERFAIEDTLAGAVAELTG